MQQQFVLTPSPRRVSVLAMQPTTVVHHSADYDGLFCREIARKFLPDAELIGWDFGQPHIPLSDITGSLIYVLDLPLGAPFGMSKPAFDDKSQDIIWIDHHKSAIESHPKTIPGYRIDGVAACRLAWQWFANNPMIDGEPHGSNLPEKKNYIARDVQEPLAVRLAGEYDIWDHRGDGDLEFQFGLDSCDPIPWEFILNDGVMADDIVTKIIKDGVAIMRCIAKRDADTLNSRSFMVDFEGLKFITLNTARCNSNTFSARDVAATGHDALMGFYFTGKQWSVSLYHAAHRKDIDLSLIAVKFGGGGHRGACGFQYDKLPFIP